MRKPSLVALALLATTGAARAEDAAPSGEDEAVRVPGERAGAFVSEAREGSTPRELTDVGSLVATLPGVHVRRLGSDDSFATLSVRGTSSSQVAIVLAGVPLTGGADPTLDLAALPLWPGTRARVYRSFAPATLGRGSLGGVMTLDPPSPTGGARTDVWAAIGSFGAARMRVGEVRRIGETHASVAVSASRSDDDFRYVAPLSSAATPEELTRANAGHAAASALASLQRPLAFAGRDGAVRLTTLAQGRRQELPGNVRAPTPMQRLDSSRLVQAIELTLPAAGQVAFARGWGRYEGLALRDSVASARALLGPSRTDDAIVAAGGAVGLRARPSAKSHLEIAADGSAERYAPGTWIDSAAPPGARRTSGALAVDARTVVLGPWSAIGSARLDTWHDSSQDTQARDRTSVRPTAFAGSELALGRTTLLTHAGAVARPPSFVERYGNRGAFLGDPSLRDERAITLDAGARHHGSVGALRLAGELALFATWADDLIVFVNQGAYGRAMATNIGRAELRGVEAMVRAALGPATLTASYTGLDTKNRSECRQDTAACAPPALPGRPAHDLTTDASVALGSLTLRYGIDYVAGLYADRTGAIRVPDRVLHGAGASWRVPGTRTVQLGLDLKNLFDLRAVQYQGALEPVLAPIGDGYEYPLPGRRFMLTARFSTDR